jgi:hypothetical protein
VLAADSAPRRQRQRGWLSAKGADDLLDQAQEVLTARRVRERLDRRVWPSAPWIELDADCGEIGHQLLQVFLIPWRAVFGETFKVDLECATQRVWRGADLEHCGAVDLDDAEGGGVAHIELW